MGAPVRATHPGHPHRSKGGRQLPARPVLFRLLRRAGDDEPEVRPPLRAPRRQPEQDLEQIHMDIAASIQLVLEEVVLRITRSLAAETGAQNLCLAGGVALNCVSNGKILRDGRFKAIWIQPASGDAGGAIGAALAAYHIQLDRPRARSNVRGWNVGRAFSVRRSTMMTPLSGWMRRGLDIEARPSPDDRADRASPGRWSGGRLV